MMIMKRIRKPKAEALLQITLLVVGIVAISYAIGSSVEVVSAEGGGTSSISGTTFACTNPDGNLGATRCDDTYFKFRCTSTGWDNYYDCRDRGTGYYCSGQLCVDGGSGDSGGSGFGSQAINYGKNALLNYLVNSAGSSTSKSSTPDTVKNEPGVFTGGFDSSILDSNIPLGSGGGVETSKLPEDPEDKGGDGILSGIIGSITGAIGNSAILKAAAGAAIIYGGLKLVGHLVGKIPGGEEWGKAISSSAPWAAAGYGIGSLLASATVTAAEVTAATAAGTVATGTFVTAGAAAAGGGAASTGLGAVLATLGAIPGLGWILAGGVILITLLTWKTEAVQVVTYECNVWQPIKGGAYCDECNKDIFPCTEYRCKSLGAACEIINQGHVDQMCVSSKDNGKYPTITAWDGALLSSNYRYTLANAVSPPDKGVYVQYTQSDDKCVPAFTKLSFGVTLNEAAYCRASVERKDNFSDMDFDLSGGLGYYNHSIEFSLPGVSAMEADNLTLDNGGNFDLYVRCEDYHGHSNPANFVFKFCVDEGPDYTTPNIESVSPLNGAPIANDQESVEATFYINEPAECRWSHLDKDYENMEGSMSCATSVTEMNAYMLYPCTTTLTGLQNNVENKFYVRCKDQPSSTELRNTNTESYKYTLIGTEPLILNWVTPNNTLVKGPTTSVKVEIEAKTSAGWDDGVSTCYYSETGEGGSYVQFYDTNSFKHSQDLWVSQGSYDFYIKCIDLGGNTDTTTINFSVEIDKAAPEITRVYREGDYLKLITDEEAECRYGTSSNVGCDYNFEEGTLMISMDNDFEHYVDWESNTNFYIKCGEIREGGRYPPQNECSLIVRPFDVL